MVSDWLPCCFAEQRCEFKILLHLFYLLFVHVEYRNRTATPHARSLFVIVLLYDMKIGKPMPLPINPWINVLADFWRLCSHVGLTPASQSPKLK